MGASYYVYVGPYIQAYNPEKMGSEEYYGCARCKQAMSTKYCPICGSTVILLTRPNQQRITFDTYKETDDRLSSFSDYSVPSDRKNFTLFEPNKGKFGHRFSGWESQIVDLVDATIKTELERFLQFFDKDIKRLKEVFGNDAVDVKWGIIGYASC